MIGDPKRISALSEVRDSNSIGPVFAPVKADYSLIIVTVIEPADLIRLP